MKRAARILLVVLIVLGLGLLGAKWYLSSSMAAAQVASQLKDLYGGPVEVEHANIGLFGASTVGGLKLFEDGKAGTEAWLTAGHVETNLSAWDILRGNTAPKELTIADAAVRLRFDPAGHLLTRLPASRGPTKQLPDIHLDHSRIILERAGQAHPLEIAGIQADLVNDGSRLVLKGTVADPAWGDWSLTGSLGKADHATDLSLKTARPVHVTLDMLRQVPFVAESVWQTVQLDGTTPGEIAFTYRPGKRASYRVALAPVNTDVKVPLINLDARRTSGKVVIEDEVIRLREVRGDAFAGKIDVNANLDFTGPNSDLNFYQIHVQNLDVEKLPKTLSSPIKGQLTGDAQMEIILTASKVQTRGGGKGVITHSHLGGPIEIELHSGGNGFHFGNPPPKAGPPAQPSPVKNTRQQRPPISLVKFVHPVRPPHSAAFAPAALVNRLHAQLGILTESLLLGAPPAKEPSKPAKAAPAKPAAPRFWEASLKMEDVNAHQFVTGLGLNLPIAITGRFSFEVQVAIPLDTPKDLKAYRASGSITAPHLAVEDFSLEQVQAHVILDRGVLRLDKLQAVVPADAAARGGKPSSRRQAPAISGTATMTVAPLGDLTADLDLRDIPLAQVAGLIPGLEDKPQGTLAGRMTARVPVKDMKTPAAWEVRGSLTSAKIRALGWTFQDVDAEVRVQQGTLALTKAQLRIEDQPITGAGDLRLTSPFAYQARVQLPDWDLATLEKLAPKLRPPVAVAGKLHTSLRLQGALEPLTFKSSGAATATGLQLAGMTFQSIKFHWQSTEQRLTVSDIQAKLYDGALTGKAVIPVQGKVAGQVNLRFEQIDVGALAQAIPKNPVRLAGKADGSIKADLPAADQGKERTAKIQLDLAAPRLRIQGIPAQRVQGSVDYVEGMIDYHLQGQTLGGRFNVQGKVAAGTTKTAAPRQEGRLQPVAKHAEALVQANPPPEGGRLQLEGIQLQQLWQALNVHNALDALRGRADLDVTYRPEGPDRDLTGSGQLTLRDLRWGQTLLAGTLNSEVKLQRNELRFSDLSGNVGAGLLSGQLALNLKQLDRSWLSLRLTGVEASRLLAPWPELAAQVDGTVDAMLRSTLGSEWNGLGRVRFIRGRIDGIDISEWRIPLTWSIAPGSGQGQINIQDSSAQVALGRATGSVQVSWGAGLRLQGGQIQFQGIDLRTLLRQLSSGSQYGSGQITGRFTFSSGDFRALGDLSGRIDATLNQVQPANFPVLRQLTPFLRTGGASASSFGTGTLRGVLAGGTLRIERFSLSSSYLQLIILGELTVRGTLDLDVDALPGPLAGTSLVRRLLRSVPVAGPVSSQFVGTVGRFLASQLIHLKVTGTVHNPQIRYQPQFLLSPEVLRFFAGR